jgi:hypothetical protein
MTNDEDHAAIRANARRALQQLQVQRLPEPAREIRASPDDILTSVLIGLGFGDVVQEWHKAKGHFR